MKLKLNDVLNINYTLQTIIDNEKNVDALFKFRLLGIAKEFEGHIANFEMIKNEKIMEYGKTDENGGVSINKEDKEAIEKFKNSMQEILDSDVAINIEKLKASDVFDKGVKTEYLIGLYQIIEE